MIYAAKHYVKISGRKFTPGEMIDIPIPEEKLERLLRLKAIEHVHTVIADPADEDTAGEHGDDLEGVRNNYASQLDNLGYDSSGAPKDDEETTEEADEKAEAPEIDVMDGIVSAAEAVIEEAASKETTKKTTSKGRKKA